jgi:peptidoglycan/LPS O-acetylase OafA/YrhL
LTLKYSYYLWAIVVMTPLMVSVGAITKCETKALSAGSEFLGWISYAVYCLHVPIFDGLKIIYSRYHWTSVPVALPSIMITLVLAVLATKYYDEPVRAYLSTKRRQRAVT